MKQTQTYRQYRSPAKLNLPPPKRHPVWRKLLIGLGIVLVVGLPVWWISHKQDPSQSAQSREPAQPSFDKAQLSTVDPTSPWVVVNKQNPLSPRSYTPTDLIAPNVVLKSAKTAEAMQLRQEAATALEALNQAASKEGVELIMVSGYRSYNAQTTVYDSMVRGFGQTQADRESARPGHSEHQTGWAVDLGAAHKECELEVCFADTPEGQWLATHAHTYGFVVRYADGKESITGYQYEPWHLRYVGKKLAEEMHRQNIATLEEFFGLPPAPSY